MLIAWVILLLTGVGAIVWGAEAFAEHLASAAAGLGVSSFALALLLAGAEPEELATAVVAAIRGSPGIALGEVVGANVTICRVSGQLRVHSHSVLLSAMQSWDFL